MYLVPSSIKIRIFQILNLVFFVKLCFAFPMPKEAILHQKIIGKLKKSGFFILSFYHKNVKSQKNVFFHLNLGNLKARFKDGMKI